MHLCGFSPECVFLCLFRSLDDVVLYSHWLHRFRFSPVCFLIQVLRGGIVAWKVALCARVGFLPVVNEGKVAPIWKCFQTHVARKNFPSMNEGVCFMGMLAIGKASYACKCLRTQVTKYLLWHLWLLAHSDCPLSLSQKVDLYVKFDIPYIWFVTYAYNTWFWVWVRLLPMD